MSNSLKSIELNNSSDIHAKLLHHLVDVSKVVQKRASDPETEELLKSNNALVNELLNAQLKPAVVERSNVHENLRAVWDEVLVRKLIDAEVDLADEKVKQYVYKQVDALIRSASALKRSEDVITLELDTKASEAVKYETITFRDVSFSLTLFPPSNYLPVDLCFNCKDLPAGMSCKTQIEMTIKNHLGKPDFVRRFNAVFGQKSMAEFSVSRLINREEYEDESFGYLKDGKLVLEIRMKADELVEVKEKPTEKPSEKPVEEASPVTETKTETEKAETKTVTES